MTVHATPTTQGRISFSADFTPTGTPEGSLDPIEVGSLLSVFHRMLSTIANTLDLGNVKTVQGWFGGSGFTLNFGQEHTFHSMQGVTQWAELDAQWDQPEAALLSHQCPQFATQSEALTLLEDDDSVDWVGLRDHVSDAWENFSRTPIDQSVFQQVTLAIVQACTTLQTQQYPFQRLCISYDAGSLWLFINHSGDYMVIFTDKDKPPQTLWLVQQAGEAFLLT